MRGGETRCVCAGREVRREKREEKGPEGNAESVGHLASSKSLWDEDEVQ